MPNKVRLAVGAIALLAVALAGCNSSSPPATPTPTPTSQTLKSPTATVPSLALSSVTATATPCPGPYYLNVGVGALAANLSTAITRWNSWLGCQTFNYDPNQQHPNIIIVDFAPAHLQDTGWAQFSGNMVYLEPGTALPANSTQPYANDANRLTCVVMHGLGHILGYQDGATNAPLIMKPLTWSTWPPTSCSTPNSP